MAESSEGPKAKRSIRTDGRGGRADGDSTYEEDNLIRALNHALRRQILRLLHRIGEPVSPVHVEAKLGLGEAPKDQLSQVSYHVKTLARLKIISLVDEEQRRGAMEHFYTSNVSETAWVLGLLERTRKSDEAKLWPERRVPASRKAP